MVRISNVRVWHKIESENRPRFGFQMVTVVCSIYAQNTSPLPHKKYFTFLEIFLHPFQCLALQIFKFLYILQIY
jgi:hypothetical protein